MRTWVIQPGFMITHGQHLYHVGISFLGAITLVAAFIAMFYTTASDALVSPHLKFGAWEHKTMYGSVQSSYANPSFIKANCQTPITALMDPVEGGNECMSLDYAGQGMCFELYASLTDYNSLPQLHCLYEHVGGDQGGWRDFYETRRKTSSTRYAVR